MPITMQEKQSSLEVRLGAQMFLAESGWRCRVEGNQNGDEVFFAVHDSYPEQSGLKLSELVKRCVWQETNRMPRSSVSA